MPNDPPTRILIVRLGAMGDILHALPAVTALRAAHPDWFLGWAVEPQWQALLAAENLPPQTTPEPTASSEQTGHQAVPRTPQMPLVNQLHLVPAKHWARHPLTPSTLSAILATRRELLAARYDLAIDFQGAIRSAVLARLARPARLVGEAAPREPLARHLFSQRIFTTGSHVIEQAAELVRTLSDTPLPLTLPLLPHDPAAEAWCLANAPSHPFVLLSPGAGWGAKRWPIERYASVARVLISHRIPVIVNASPSEQPLAERLTQQSGGQVLVPSLAQLLALTRRAALVIAGDTGPLHLAAALGRPTVGIYGPTDPARNGPFHGRHIVLRHPESKRDHTRREQPEAGLLTITPNHVLDAAFTLLAPPTGSDAPQLEAR